MKKYIRLIVGIVFFSFPLMSCIDEPAQPASEKEIINEISREWNCSMDEDGFPVDFTAVISADPTDGTKILISNFHKIGTDYKVYVIVNKDLTLNIPGQLISNEYFKGSGIISDDYTEITWNYSIEYDDGTTAQVSGKYSYGVSS